MPPKVCLSAVDAPASISSRWSANAVALNKHRSSVSRLIKRCPGEEFNPKASYEKYLENRKKRKKKIGFKKEQNCLSSFRKDFIYTGLLN